MKARLAVCFNKIKLYLKVEIMRQFKFLAWNTFRKLVNAEDLKDVHVLLNTTRNDESLSFLKTKINNHTVYVVVKDFETKKILHNEKVQVFVDRRLQNEIL